MDSRDGIPQGGGFWRGPVCKEQLWSVSTVSTEYVVIRLFQESRLFLVLINCLQYSALLKSYCPTCSYHANYYCYLRLPGVQQRAIKYICTFDNLILIYIVELSWISLVVFFLRALSGHWGVQQKVWWEHPNLPTYHQVRSIFFAFQLRASPQIRGWHKLLQPLW